VVLTSGRRTRRRHHGGRITEIAGATAPFNEELEMRAPAPGEPERKEIGRST
jgi:hypothetical protein